jgi:hypothetical protein
MNTTQLDNNQDLTWDFTQVDQKDKAKEFINFFKNKLCIFSPSVNKIYTNYNFLFPEGLQCKMVVLPNRYSFHDTVSNISSDAITPTGLHIIPGSRINKKEPYLVISHSNPNIKSIPIPFKKGIKLILERQHSDNPFLPILTRGDLRQFNETTPSLHLNRLNINKLTSLSQFEREDIKHVIIKNTAKLYLEASKLCI